MARGSTLTKLLDDLRAECRLSTNVAHNTQNREAQIHALQRKQEWFWHDFSWPHLRVERSVALQDGQRYYDMPADLDIDRIEKIEVRDAGVLCPLDWGIAAEHLAAHDSDLDSRSSPARRVRISEGEMLEVWPIPDTNASVATRDGFLRITGIKHLAPLVADDDRADLDDRLLVLHCAAEYLAATGAKDAQVKMDQANALYLKLRGGLMPRKVFDMFGSGERTRVKRVPIAIYKAP